MGRIPLALSEQGSATRLINVAEPERVQSGAHSSEQGSATRLINVAEPERVQSGAPHSTGTLGTGFGKKKGWPNPRRTRGTRRLQNPIRAVRERFESGLGAVRVTVRGTMGATVGKWRHRWSVGEANTKPSAQSSHRRHQSRIVPRVSPPTPNRLSLSLSLSGAFFFSNIQLTDIIVF